MIAAVRCSEHLADREGLGPELVAVDHAGPADRSSGRARLRRRSEVIRAI